MPPRPHDTFGWLEVEEIGERLCEAHPNLDPLTVGFVRLTLLVAALPGFKEEPGHPCNEKILEHIQGAWIEEARGNPRRARRDDA